MALTKVTGQVINDTTGLVVGVTTVGGGISATDGFFSGIVTAVGNASFSGNVSVGGTLTYEDVTNIDAVGLVTARNGVVVGSGITLSKDGDIFFTGIMTGNGSGLTNIATDLVNDTTPQLGGALDTNDKSIAFGDSNNDATASGTLNRLKFGAGTDMVIYHNGTDNFIKNPNGTFKVFTGADKQSILAVPDGTVSLHFNDDKKLETTSGGVTVTGTLAATAVTGDGSGLTGIGGTDFIHSEQINNSGVTTTGKLRIDVNSTSGTGSGNVEAIFLRNTNETDGNAVAIFGGADDYSNAGSAINFVNVDHSANVGQIQFDTRNGSNSYAGRIQITSDGHLRPVADNVYDIGSSSLRFRNIYTGDLHCSNKGSSNDVDGTWGNYTIQEGESDLFLINNRSGKKYKFNLTEVS